MSDQLFKLFNIVIKESDDKERIITAIGSKQVIDRDRDIVDIKGVETKKYKANPVVLWSHNYFDLPIGKAVGKKVWIDGDELKFKIQFAPEEISPKAGFIYNLYKEGYLNSFSIGFIPDYSEMEYVEETKKLPAHRLIKKSELLEISCVNVPANSAAVMAMANKAWEAGTIDGSDLQNIEEWCKDEECESCDIPIDIKELTDDEFLSEEEVKHLIEEKPYENEHACRLNDPKKYDRFARKNCYKKSDGKCIDFIFGIKEGKSEVQSLRYNKKKWTEADAKAHCKDKEGKFEAAKKSVDNYIKKEELEEIVKNIIEEKDWIYNKKDWLYLVHHMHPNSKNVLSMEELHHCDLFTEKDMKGDKYEQKHIKNGGKHLHAIDTDNVKSIPKVLYDHINNMFKITKKTIDDEKYAVLSGIIDDEKLYDALETKEEDIDSIYEEYFNELYDGKEDTLEEMLEELLED